MAPSYSKEEFIIHMEQSHQELVECLEHLEEKDWLTPKTCGMWSIKDVIAHITDWEKRGIDWYLAGKQGEMVKTPDVNFEWDQLDALNNAIYINHINEPLTQVQQAFSESWNRTLSVVRTMTAEELFLPHQFPWLFDYILADVIEGNTTTHYQGHLKLINTYLQSKKVA